MYVVYILRSINNDRYYIGHTSNLTNRLKRHNNGLVRSTKAYKPWTCIYTEEIPDKKGAFKREMEVKSYKSGLKFRSLIKMK